MMDGVGVLRVEGEHALVFVDLVVGARDLDLAEVGADQGEHFIRDGLIALHDRHP